MRRGIDVGSWWRPAIGATAVAVLLGGCSSVPDAVNPVKWYENTVELFSGEEEKSEAAAAPEEAPGADKPFPTLNSVPEKPETSSAEERARVAEGLVSDQQNRRYGSAVERQGAPSNSLNAAPPTPTPETSPAASSMPPAPRPVAPMSSSGETSEASPAPSIPEPAETAEVPRALSAPPPAPNVGMDAPALPESDGTASAPSEVPQRVTQPVAPANAMVPMADEGATVVISSDGIQDTRPVMAQAAPRVPPALASPAAPRMEQSMRIATIQFKNASSDLDARDQSILRQVVALQRERGGVIRVVGHASARTANMDPVQHKLVNYRMSEERAQAVVEALVRLGAPADAVVAAAKSDTDPVYYEFMPSGEAGNRRAEIYLDF